MNEKLERMMREVKISRRTQSIPDSKDNGQTTSRIETPKHINSDDGEMTASDTEIQNTVCRIIVLGHQKQMNLELQSNRFPSKIST